MKSHGQKLPSIFQQAHHTYPYIYMWPTNRNPNLIFYLLNLPPPSSNFHTNYIYYLFSKHLWNIPHLILIKPTQFPHLIQILYHFWKHMILNSMCYWVYLTPSITDIYFKWGRYSWEVILPLSCISYIPHCFWWNNTLGNIHMYYWIYLTPSIPDIYFKWGRYFWQVTLPLSRISYIHKCF